MLNRADPQRPEPGPAGGARRRLPASRPTTPASGSVIFGGMGSCSPRATTSARTGAQAERSGPGRLPHPRRSTAAPREGAEQRMLQEWHYYFQNTLRWRNLRKITIAQVQGSVSPHRPHAHVVLRPDRGRRRRGVRRRGGRPPRHVRPRVLRPPVGDSGARKTKELMLTGDSLDVDEAHRLGMVSKVFPAPSSRTRRSSSPAASPSSRPWPRS